MKTQRALSKLGHEVAKELDEMADKAMLADVRRRLVEPLPHAPRTRASWVRPFALGVPLVAAAAAALLFFVPRGPGDLAFEVGEPPSPGVVGAWTTPPSEKSVPIQFDDGARFEVAPGARTRVGSATEEQVWLIHEAGSLSGAVVAGDSGARYRVTAGPFEATSQRARFDVEWNPDTGAFQLTVHAGVVRVVSPQSRDGVSVEAGRRVKANAREERLEIATTSASPPDAPAP